MKTKMYYKMMSLEAWLIPGWIVSIIIYGKQSLIFKIISFMIIVLVLYLIIQYDKTNIEYKEYERGQFLENWYEKTVKRNGFEWIIATGEIIQNLYKECHINILSVAANKGTYEKEMYKNMVNKGCKVRLLVSDKSNIDHEKDSEDGISRYEYASGIDAFECEKHLINKGINRVHVILDFKGATWYQLKKYGEVEKLFDLYNKVLEENGVIIFDNGKIQTVKKILYYMQHVFLAKPGTENSTYYYFNKKILKDPEFKKYIESRFIIEIHKVDEIRNISIVLLKKRAC